MQNLLFALLVVMLGGRSTQAVQPKEDEEARPDRRTLIAEPLIERGSQASVLGGLDPDEEILRLIELYDAGWKHEFTRQKEAREKLLGSPSNLITRRGGEMERKFTRPTQKTTTTINKSASGL